VTDHDDYEPTTLQTRLWNAIPDLPPRDRAMAERIAGSEEMLPKRQIRAAWAMIKKTRVNT